MNKILFTFLFATVSFFQTESASSVSRTSGDKQEQASRSVAPVRMKAERLGKQLVRELFTKEEASKNENERRKSFDQALKRRTIKMVIQDGNMKLFDKNNNMVPCVMNAEKLFHTARELNSLED